MNSYIVVRKIRFSIFVPIAVGFCLTANASPCKVFGKSWYRLDERGLELSSPIMNIEYRQGSIFRDGKKIDRPALLTDLHDSASLQPHPRVLLLVAQADCKKYRRLVREIEQTGICKDSGCLYKFKSKRRT
ncbi:hypothetical protein [Sphingomonas sp.]|uniref:hypothetical protein n=1 Tax=Sphingomonas sp. TaxID=28214 RepID=UPI003D6CC2DD